MAQECCKRESFWEELYFLSCWQNHDYGLGNVTMFPYLIFIIDFIWNIGNFILFFFVLLLYSVNPEKKVLFELNLA